MRRGKREAAAAGARAGQDGSCYDWGFRSQEPADSVLIKGQSTTEKKTQDRTHSCDCEATGRNGASKASW
jgi:hypothetical protein